MARGARRSVSSRSWPGCGGSTSSAGVSGTTTRGPASSSKLRGTDLLIQLQTHGYAAGRATYDPANDSEAVDVGGFRTFRQVAWAGSHEGASTLGLGVRARLPFRVTVLAGAPGRPNGARVVVDVAHAW